jgi:N-acetylglucosamine-6-phosphate deacetylase
MLALTAKTLLTPLERIERPLVLIEEGRVVHISSQLQTEVPVGAERADCGDNILAPGLVDVHVHGGAGYDVMEGDEPGRREFEEFLVRRGVTSYYPTTVTAPLDVILRALERLASAIEASRQSSNNRAQPLGIHLEGPFLSHVRRGVHPPESLLDPDIRTFEKLWQASRGHIRLMTIAPELPGAIELISAATQRSVCVSLGHSDATLEQTRAAISAGARHATHTFNAMRPLDHRNPGILGEVLMNPALTADLIADGVHVHPSMVRLFLEAKGTDGAVLITDATSATGMPDGRYRLGSFEVDVHEGKCLHDGKLAGSVLTLDRAVQNVMSFTGLELKDAVRLATLNPAKVANAERKGKIAVGSDADFAVLNAAGEVHASIVKGTIVQQ